MPLELRQCDHKIERTCLLGSAIFFCSDFEHKMEGELLKLLRQNKEAGGSASLTFFTTRDGKLKAKLEVELDPSAPTSPGSTSPLPATAPAPGGGRRRRKGASAKAKAKARAALHRATQAAATLSPPASGDASAPLEAPAPHQQYHPPLRHPPQLLPSPSPSSGRRQVMSVGRLPIPSFGSLNLDGHCTWKSRKPEVVKPQILKLRAPPPFPPPPPPPPPLPPPPALRLRCETGVATRVSATWRNRSSSEYMAVIITETKGGCHCHGHSLVHHHLLPSPRAASPTTPTAAPPTTVRTRIPLRILVGTWTRTGVSYVLGHADSAMTFVLTFVILVEKQWMPF